MGAKEKPDLPKPVPVDRRLFQEIAELAARRMHASDLADLAAKRLALHYSGGIKQLTLRSIFAD